MVFGFTSAMNKKIGLFLSCILLASCSPSTLLSSGNKDARVQKSTQATQQNAIALPPSFNKLPSNPLQNLQPARGFNVDTFFSEELKDPEARFERVENAVLGLIKEFETLRPSIIRLVAVESDIQDLITQLDVLLQEDIRPQTSPIALTPPLMPAAHASNHHVNAAKAAPTPITPPATPSAQPNATLIKDLRIGQHAHKSRIVLDINKETPYTIDLDNAERFLVIELPTATWTRATQKTFNSPLLSSYSVEQLNNGQGSRIVIYLKKSTTILEKMALKPGSNPNFRLFIDLAH